MARWPQRFPVKKGNAVVNFLVGAVFGASLMYFLKDQLKAKVAEFVQKAKGKINA